MKSSAWCCPGGMKWTGRAEGKSREADARLHVDPILISPSLFIGGV